MCAIHSPSEGAAEHTHRSHLRQPLAQRIDCRRAGRRSGVVVDSEPLPPLRRTTAASTAVFQWTLWDAHTLCSHTVLYTLCSHIVRTHCVLRVRRRVRPDLQPPPGLGLDQLILRGQRGDEDILALLDPDRREEHLRGTDQRVQTRGHRPEGTDQRGGGQG